MLSSAKSDYKADRKLDPAVLKREQEKLRLESLRYLEQLQIRQNRYRSGQFFGHRFPCQSYGSTQVDLSVTEQVVTSNDKESSINGGELQYPPVSSAVRSSLQGFDSLLNTSERLAEIQNSRRHMDVGHSATAVLSDNLCREKWSVSATQAARRKLISGRIPPQTNMNNSSSVDAYVGSKLLEASIVSRKFKDSNGELVVHNADYSSSVGVNIDQLKSCETPPKLEQSLEGTPKSILRHRQIIDDNVVVKSKFDHTPTKNVRSRKHRRGLNFSYSDVDDAQLFGHKAKSVNFSVDSSNCTPESTFQQTAASQDETQVKQPSASSAVDILPASSGLYYAPSLINSSGDFSEISNRSSIVSGLLLQTGNDRQNASIVRELESRSQSGLFSGDQPVLANGSQSQVVFTNV